MACDWRRIAEGGAAAQRAATFAPYVASAAARYGVPADAVLATIRIESNFSPTAVSSVGAVGLMQLMPSTGRAMADALGVSPYTPTDPEQNVHLGTYLLSRLYARWGDWGDVARAYFWGSGNLAKWKRGERDIPASVVRYERRWQEERANAAAACSGSVSPFPRPSPSAPRPSPSPLPSPSRPPSSASGGGAALMLLALAWALR